MEGRDNEFKEYGNILSLDDCFNTFVAKAMDWKMSFELLCLEDGGDTLSDLGVED